MLDRLKTDNLPVKLFSLFRVLHCRFQRSMGNADSLRANTRTSPVKCPHGKDKSHTLPTYNIFLRDFAILEDQFPRRRGPDTQLVLFFTECKPFHSFLKDKCRCPSPTF